MAEGKPLMAKPVSKQIVLRRRDIAGFLRYTIDRAGM
jgi:hypothetical protein